MEEQWKYNVLKLIDKQDKIIKYIRNRKHHSEDEQEEMEADNRDFLFLLEKVYLNAIKNIRDWNTILRIRIRLKELRNYG